MNVAWYMLVYYKYGVNDQTDDVDDRFVLPSVNTGASIVVTENGVETTEIS